jgi:quercetin dioxygenase-like cupin family protein
MRVLWLAAMLGMLLGGGSAAAQHDAAIILAPDQLTWGAPLPNGAKVAVMEGNPKLPGPFTMRVILPANWRIAPHVHRGVEYLTVLSGTLYAGHGERFDASDLKALPAGGFMVMPANTPHFMMVREETTVQVQSVGPWVVTYVNAADDSRKK